MKSEKSGMNAQSFDNKAWFLNLKRNCKIETVIVAIGLLWLILIAVTLLTKKWTFLQLLRLDVYFTDDRCAGIVSYLSIAIGVYVTVWSIFATSASKLNTELLRDNVEKQLFFVIVIGLVESFITVLLCVFIPNCFVFYARILLILVVLSSISFGKFVIILMQITKLNIKYIVEEIDQQNVEKVELFTKIDEIYKVAIEIKKTKGQD